MPLFKQDGVFSRDRERDQGYAFYAARGLALFLHQSDHMRSFHRRFLGLLRKTISPVLALRSIPRLETDEPPFILVSPPHPTSQPLHPCPPPPIRPSTLSLFFPKNRTSEHGPPHYATILEGGQYSFSAACVEYIAKADVIAQSLGGVTLFDSSR